MSTRSKRARRPVKQQDDEYVDLDSDEFENALEGRDVTPQRKRQKPPEPAEAVAAPAAAAAATADAVEQDEEEVPDEDDMEVVGDDEELEEVVEVDDDDAESGSDAEADSGSDDEPQAVQGKKKGKQDKKQPKKKRRSTRRLCASYAKAQYRLTDNDLKQLTDVEYRDNPHYSGGYPMKLYLVRELEELARKKQERKAQEQETKAERAAARALEVRERKAAAAAAAAAKVATHFDPKGPRDERHGSVKLPDTCLAKIMACLAGSLEPGGLRGPSCVANDLAQAALVCWDFYHAAKAGFVALGAATATLQQVEPPEYLHKSVLQAVRGLYSLPGLESLGGWGFWDQVLSQPTSLKLSQLKDAARQLAVQVTGTKAELILRILGAFGLDAPTTAPAQLLRSLLLERHTKYEVWDGPNTNWLRVLMVDVVMPASQQANWHLDVQSFLQARRQKGVAGMRAALRAAGFSSMADVRQAVDAARREEQKKMQAAAAARAQAEVARRAAFVQQLHLQPRTGPTHGRACACGNTAAIACTRDCCASCCRALALAPGAARCERHRT